MLRRPKTAFPSEVPVLEDEPAWLDPSAIEFVPGLKASLREADDRDESLGFRRLIERPEALSSAWDAAVRRRSNRRKPRPSRGAPAWSRAA
ncbi:MAG: hypothetical protein U0414_41335 [Polyangiaceae bacterium]